MPRTKIFYTPVPPKSLLQNYMEKGDFTDCVFAPGEQVEADISILAQKALAEMPGWVNWLMRLRNAIVGLFGLKTGKGQSFGNSVPENLKPGDRIGVFKVETIANEEIILGENDKHLNFRISIFKTGDGVSLSTWVRPHNFWGRAYLAVVMPFHRLITQSTVKRIVVDY